MLRRSALKSITRWMLAAMLFAQGMVALAACAGPQRSPAQAIAAASEHDGRPCHEGGDSVVNANVCLEHCLGADRSLDVPQVKVPAWSPAPFIVAPRAPAVLRAAAEPAEVSFAQGALPPPHILFLSLRI